MRRSKFQQVGQFSIHGQRSQVWLNAPWGLLSAAAVGLLAIWLTVGHGLPYGHDSTGHIYRLVERDYLIRHGLLFTRWSPFFGYGYGYPLYNYYQPLLSYLAEPLMLIGLGPLVALQIVLGLALISGATGMYLWIKGLFGAGAGVMAATAYIFSPYVMYTLLNRAGFPEIVALACLPWNLWALNCYAATGNKNYEIATAIILAAIFLAHLFTAFMFIATLGVYLVVLSWARSGRSWSLVHLLLLSKPVVLGLGLAAFFWLPAVAETNLIYIERVLQLGNPTVGQGLMPFWQVFSGSVLPDLVSPVATIAPRLSWFTAGIALLGTWTGLLALRSHVLKLHILVAIVMTTAAVFMLTPSARWLWQMVPLLRLGQFPFRFLVVANLWLVLLAGSGTGALLSLVNKPVLLNRSMTALIVVGLCLPLVLYTLGWLAVAYHSSDMATNLVAAMQFERKSSEMGNTGKSEYLPKSVRQVPPAATGPTVGEARLNVRSLPDKGHQIAAEYNFLNYKITVDSPEAFQAIIKTFYFPGWWAKINGQRVSITPSEPYGLITLLVPAGRQQIEIGFGTTPIRMVATGISLLSAICLLVLLMKLTQLAVIVDQWVVSIVNIAHRTLLFPRRSHDVHIV